MTQPYSEDLCERALARSEAGETIRALGQALSVSPLCIPTPLQDLRRTLSPILWRHQNGAKWRAIPADLGPWWRAAQVFIRWAMLLAPVPWAGRVWALPFLTSTWGSRAC